MLFSKNKQDLNACFCALRKILKNRSKFSYDDMLFSIVLSLFLFHTNNSEVFNLGSIPIMLILCKRNLKKSI